MQLLLTIVDVAAVSKQMSHPQHNNNDISKEIGGKLRTIADQFELKYSREIQIEDIRCRQLTDVYMKIARCFRNIFT